MSRIKTAPTDTAAAVRGWAFSRSTMKPKTKDEQTSQQNKYPTTLPGPKYLLSKSGSR
jgi:hypothetical protein